ncbi:MAG: DUF547 domain-containing protein, partial [Symploca sp. SIO2D2]|nr:DUF547 domain-containing protein [Symploca sp. SIO2D2]
MPKTILKILAFAATCLAFSIPTLHAEVTPEQRESTWNALLETYLNEQGLWNYASLVAERNLFDQLYESLSKSSPDATPNRYSSEDEQLAYWINAYNIATVRGVLDHYPIESVIDVKKPSFFSLFEGGGFFVAQKFRIGDSKTSLYKLENKVVRKRFLDPRYHFALNCAASGCPQLP